MRRMIRMVVVSAVVTTGVVAAATVMTAATVTTAAWPRRLESGRHTSASVATTTSDRDNLRSMNIESSPESLTDGPQRVRAQTAAQHAPPIHKA